MTLQAFAWIKIPISRPIKWRQFYWDGELLAPFAAIEFRILAAVQKTFDLADDYLLNITSLSKLVDGADRDQLRRERRDLFDARQPLWGSAAKWTSDQPPLPAVLDPERAEEEFLYEFWRWFQEED